MYFVRSCTYILGIQVAEFSLDGKHASDYYLNNTEGIGPNNLTDFTLCLRFNVNFLKPISNAILSYSTFLEDNALNVEVIKQSGGSLLIYICKYIKREQVSISWAGTFNSMCFYSQGANNSIKNLPRVVGTIKKIQWKYINNGIISVYLWKQKI